MQHGKIKILFFPRNVHTERIGAGPCMACDHAPKEKKSYGKNSWEIWEKLGIGGKKLWEKWEKLGNLWEKKSEYGKNWVRFLVQECLIDWRCHLIAAMFPYSLVLVSEI